LDVQTKFIFILEWFVIGNKYFQTIWDWFGSVPHYSPFQCFLRNDLFLYSKEKRLLWRSPIYS
jgi:hypothetical protein